MSLPNLTSIRLSRPSGQTSSLVLHTGERDGGEARLKHMDPKRPSGLSRREQVRRRRLNQGRYALEDFRDAAADLELGGWLVAGLGLLFSSSALFLGASSLWQGLLSMLSGALFAIAAPRIDWRAWSNIYLAVLGWVIAWGAEWRLLGLPDQLIPGFLEMGSRKVINLLALLNALSPFLYIGLKLLFLLPLLRLARHRRRVDRLPNEVKRELGIEFW